MTGRATAHVPRLLASAVLACAIASVAAPARAASVLSDGMVTPGSGTTATSFTFSVHYTSEDSPQRPAQSVWAQVGSTTVTLIKVSGSANDGTWEGSATLPAGTWQVTFHASTSAEPQPAPLQGPTIVVTDPPPTPQPPPPPPAPQPTAVPNPPPPNPPPPATPGPTRTSSATPAASSSPRSGSPSATATATTSESDEPSASPDATDLAVEQPAPPPGSMLASILFVGGTMSIAGAAVLARQWMMTRREPSD